MKNAACSSILAATLVLLLGVAAQAQPAKKVIRIGYLSATDPADESTHSEAIRLALRELGYIDGQNIAIEYRYGEGKVDRQSALASELVRLRLISSWNQGGTLFARARMRPRRFLSLWWALHERGYIEGQNIATDYRYAEGKRDRLPELAAELVRLKVDIILAASGDLLIRTAMKATKTIAIVMVVGASDPVEAGLIDSLARPGGNVTGVTNLGRELGGKRLELLKEAVPKLARVAVLYEPAIRPV